MSVETYTHCGECRQRIPWGESRYIEMRRYHVVREVCLGCIVKKTRGRTGSAPRDTEATSQATVHATGDSGGSGTREPRFRSAPPQRRLPVPDVDERRVGKRG